MIRQMTPISAKAGATETPSAKAHPSALVAVQVPCTLRPSASVASGAKRADMRTMSVVMNGTGCPSASVTTGVRKPLSPLYCSVSESDPRAPPARVSAWNGW